MKTREIATVLFAAGFALVWALSLAANADQQNIDSISLNVGAFDYAKELIREGHVVADRRAAWSEHQTSAEQENEFIRLHGFGEYAKWHLGIEHRYPENTKRRYKFPYGDFKDVHRSGVLAAQSRAAQYKHYEIANAAAQLITMIGMTTEAQGGR